MRLMKGNRWYVRVDYRVGEREANAQEFQAHLAYVQEVAKQRYFAGGGFTNTPGGMCLFEATNIEEARQVAQGDPIIQSGLYRCDVFEWQVLVVSENAGAI